MIEKKSFVQEYHYHIKRKKRLVVLFMVLLLAMAFYALNRGSMEIDFWTIIESFNALESNSEMIAIQKIRLPRIIGAILTGMALALAGCVMQNILRNPLASPQTLGITNAAAFGANVAIVALGAGSVTASASESVIINNPYVVVILAFVFSMAASMTVLLLAKTKAFSAQSIVLAGVALGSLFAAGTTIIQYFGEDTQVAAAVFWTFGDLGRASYNEIVILAVAVVLCGIYFMLKRWDYNALDAGEESAKGLGVNVERTRFTGMLLSAFITSMCVSFFGIIGFVGLVTPHIMRKFVGGDHRFLIPLSGLFGGFVLLLSDTIARTIIAPVILPVGAITSFFGAPLFLFLLWKGGNSK